MKNTLGLTKPIQKLANHFDIDYSSMYRFADWVIHSRIPHDSINDSDRMILTIAARNVRLEYKEFLQVLILNVNAIYEDVKANA